MAEFKTQVQVPIMPGVVIRTSNLETIFKVLKKFGNIPEDFTTFLNIISE